MQFNSMEFIFWFLPAFLIVSFTFRAGLRRAVLILGSLVFCALAGDGAWWWAAMLAGVTVISYVVQRYLYRSADGAGIWACLGLMAGILIYFKVSDGGANLPAGMSFYMFQIAAILLDVYWGKLPPEERFLDYAEQIVFFPKLLSGPLMDPKKLRQQCRERQFRLVNVYEGLKILVLGLALKVLLANRLGGLWVQPAILGYEHISTPAAWLAIISYAMQLYLDFYGYSLMAIGLGKMLGYDLPANFRDPYASRSVSEFYRRWHITLGAWFREYVYIPLGGNRHGMARTLLNIAIVWLFTGLWHGIGGNYLLWAGFNCFWIFMERLWLGKILEKQRIFSHVYLIFVILLSWIPFAVGKTDQMLIFTGRLFGLCGKAMNPRDFVDWLKMYWWLLGISGAMMTPFPGKLWKKYQDTLLADILIFVMFWAVVYVIATAAQDPFMYFRY